MNERRDDTTKPETESRPARRPGSYYYDDATGYEIYKPDESEEESGGEESGGAAANDAEQASGDNVVRLSDIDDRTQPRPLLTNCA